jgi:dTDP-4-dehydrorhamnose reductase
MRAVVIGGSGQLGGWLLRRLAERGHWAVGTYKTVAYPGLVHVDAGSEGLAASWLVSQRPDVVFYPAGFTYVDGCERDPQRAYAANRDQPLNLARAVRDLIGKPSKSLPEAIQNAGPRFVYFSTDYVFDGTDGPYDESARPNPVNVYGRAKFEAEAALLGVLGPSLLLVRTSWVFGPERQGKNFAYQVVRALAAGQPMTCPLDLYSSPSYAPDVARAVVDFVESGITGLMHVAGPETVSRVAFAQQIARAFGLDPALIVARKNDEPPQQAPRPLSGGLKARRLERLGTGAMRPLEASLRDFVRRLDAREGWADPREPA